MESTMNLGGVTVMATSNRGFTPEEIADRAIEKIIYIGQDTLPEIKEQAEAFRDQLKQLLVFYFNEAIKSDRTTLASRFNSAGYPELVKLLEN